MKMPWLWVLSLLLITTSFRAVHEYYVGITDIRYNAESATCEIALKVFTDDLELAVQKHSGILTHLGTKKEVAMADSLVAEYVFAHFSLARASGDKAELTFIGREIELDVTWIYIESEPLKPLASLLVSNDMFLEIYESQTHIVHFQNNESKHSTLLRKGKTSDTLGK